MPSPPRTGSASPGSGWKAAPIRNAMAWRWAFLERGERVAPVDGLGAVNPTGFLVMRHGRILGGSVAGFARFPEADAKSSAWARSPILLD
jgi:hypothetical protein